MATHAPSLWLAIVPCVAGGSHSPGSAITPLRHLPSLSHPSSIATPVILVISITPITGVIRVIGVFIERAPSGLMSAFGGGAEIAFQGRQDRF